MAMVALEAVTKTFGGRTVIRPTTLAIEKGERLALIGPSGCGKSTLLKMVLGLVVPSPCSTLRDSSSSAVSAMRGRTPC